MRGVARHKVEITGHYTCPPSEYITWWVSFLERSEGWYKFPRMKNLCVMLRANGRHCGQFSMLIFFLRRDVLHVVFPFELG